MPAFGPASVETPPQSASLRGLRSVLGRVLTNHLSNDAQTWPAFAASPPDERKGCAFPADLQKLVEAPPPHYLFYIHGQGLVFKRPSIPNPRTRIKILIRVFDESRLHRIEVNVIYFLLQHRFARHEERIRMMFPNRIFVPTLLLKHLEFFQRRYSIHLQMIQYSFRGYTIQVSQCVRGSAISICDDVIVIHHDHISEDQESRGATGLI
jgi:hypothetical protein